MKYHQTCYAVKPPNNNHLSTSTTSNPTQAQPNYFENLPLNNDRRSTTTSGDKNLVINELKTCLQQPL